ncbi:MAG: DedA family protein [Pyrinomonadaceae bacterium]
MCIAAALSFVIYRYFDPLWALIEEYGDFILQQIELYMVMYGYWVVFFGVMLENAGLPIPGETILLVAGYFASAGHFNIFLVMLIAGAGAVVGDNAGFAVGHHYGRGFLLRFGKYVFLTPKRLEHLENYFQSHGNKTVFVARFITGLRVFAAILAGASKMRWRIFLLYNVAGAIVWSIVITSLGYLFGQSLPLLVKWVGRSGTILLVVGLVIAVIAWRIYQQRAEEK